MKLGEQKTDVALITGGTSGIGLALAKKLAASYQSHIFVVSNQMDQGIALRAIFEETYQVKYYFLYQDLTAEDALANIDSFCQTNHLKVKILVNNAGILVSKLFLQANRSTINSLLHLQVHILVNLSHFFGKRMIEDGKGYILNVSSISAVMPFPLISVYGPAKAFVKQFTIALRSELKPSGVYVTCLVPGATDTSLYKISPKQKRLVTRLGVMHSPEYVADKAIRGLMKNKGSVIPGLLNKITVCIFPIIPQTLIDVLFRVVKK